jgi:pyruvate/2-oxoglutarate dehydrogenase complex dihydrolipoamide dehydrogenase (E3) component
VEGSPNRPCAHPLRAGVDMKANGGKMAPTGEPLQLNMTGGTVADNAGNNFDVLILGAGSGGYACALRASQLGLNVALVEKGKIGGTCLHVGCIPTKALLQAAEVADSARESEQFGVNASLEGIDMAGVNKYKDGVVSRLFKGLTGLVKARA